MTFCPTLVDRLQFTDRILAPLDALTFSLVLTRSLTLTHTFHQWICGDRLASRNGFGFSSWCLHSAMVWRAATGKTGFERWIDAGSSAWRTRYSTAYQYHRCFLMYDTYWWEGPTVIKKMFHWKAVFCNTVIINGHMLHIHVALSCSSVNGSLNSSSDTCCSSAWGDSRCCLTNLITHL